MLLPTVIESRAGPEPVTVVTFRDAVSPAGADVDRTTTPLKPFIEPTVMSEVLVEPTMIVWEEGLADTVKSDTSIVITTVWVRGPLVPSTST